MSYFICEISGRQYLVEPGKILLVDKLSGEKKFKINKVLLQVTDDQVEVGSPYLKTSLEFEVVGEKTSKVRVATYKAKANYRRVIGSQRQETKILLVNQTSVKKKD